MWIEVQKANGNTYTASSNFFSAMALLPRALSSSTEAMASRILLLEIDRMYCADELWKLGRTEIYETCVTTGEKVVKICLVNIGMGALGL